MSPCSILVIIGYACTSLPKEIGTKFRFIGLDPDRNDEVSFPQKIVILGIIGPVWTKVMWVGGYSMEVNSAGLSGKAG